MLHSHQRCQGPEGLPGQYTPRGTWQHHAGSGEEVIREGSRSQADFLSACQATLYTSPPDLKSALAASYHILLGQMPPSPPFILSQRVSPVEELPTPAAPPTPVPKQCPRPKRQHPSQILWRAHLWANHFEGDLGGLPSSKWQEIPPWDRALKLSHAEAFGQDSDLVKDARREFFLKHSYNFITEAPAISQRYLSRWPQAPNYWALPSTKSRCHGWDLVN